MIWANFLHFYQPPTQKKYWVDRITNESYRRLLKEIQNHPKARLTINIAASLLELWDKFGHDDLIEGYRRLVQRGQIEVTGSAKYHPLLPKLPDDEIVRQIMLNELTLHKYLGVTGPAREESPDPGSDGLRSGIRLRGFFPPEMAFDARVAKVVASLGYEWVICEELSYADELGQVDYSKLYEIKIPDLESPDPGSKTRPPLMIFFRDRYASYKILSGQLGTANLFLKEFQDRFSKDVYLLTAMDGETFGHHRPGLEKLLFELYRIPKLKTATLSQVKNHFRKVEAVAVKPATWALMEKDVEKKVALARWEDPDNEIHKLQWQLTNLAIELVQNSKIKMQNENLKLKNSILNFDLSTLNLSIQALDKLSPEEKSLVEARNLLDQALHSDQYWWASARPWWSLEMIERGAKELLDVVLILAQADKGEHPVVFDSQSWRFKPATTTPGSRIPVASAWALYLNIVMIGFDWQRSGKVEAMSQKEDEDIRMRTDSGLPKTDPAEIKKMIKTLAEEMTLTARYQEFERAGQLRDRIRELKVYLKK